LPSGADDRYFRDGEGNSLGQLGERLDLVDVDALGLTDEWLGIAVDLKLDRPSCLWTHPIETVSQSEGGFELVHQSVVVEPHWYVEADAQGRWSVQMRLAIDTAAAEERRRTAESHNGVNQVRAAGAHVGV
jgi:alpha-amylase